MPSTIPLPDPDLNGSPRQLGESLEELGRLLWARMDRDQRAQILWDLPAGQDKEAALQAILAAAATTFFALDKSRLPRAAVWASPTCPGSATWTLHFATAGYCPAASLRLPFLQFINTLPTTCRLLLALLPLPWRGARNFAHALGFADCLRLPGACHISRHNRHVDGALLSLRLYPDNFKTRRARPALESSHAHCPKPAGL